MKEYGFERSSRLEGATPTQVWERVTSWEGVNDELAPFVKMTHPARFPAVTDVPADGRSHFTSYFLLLGVLPFDAHRVAFRELVVPEHFDELSSNLLIKRWHHRRTVTPAGNAVEVRDEVDFEARLPFLGALLARIYGAVFDRRHAKLRERFGDDPTSRAS